MNRCPECRTRRATLLSLLAHVATAGHRVCTCGGYHYSHRPFSRFCKKNPMYEVHVAQREGAERDELLEIEADCAWEKAGRPLRSWVVFKGASPRIAAERATIKATGQELIEWTHYYPENARVPRIAP